jgi:hypothetical protein
MIRSRLLAGVSLFVFWVQAWGFQAEPRSSAPPLLTFSELTALARPQPAPEAVMRKLQHLLNTPFVENRAPSPSARTPTNIHQGGGEWRGCSGRVNANAAQRDWQY